MLKEDEVQRGIPVKYNWRRRRNTHDKKGMDSLLRSVILEEEQFTTTTANFWTAISGSIYSTCLGMRAAFLLFMLRNLQKGVFAAKFDPLFFLYCSQLFSVAHFSWQEMGLNRQRYICPTHISDSMSV